MLATAFIVWALYRMHTKYEAALLEKVNLKLLLDSTAHMVPQSSAWAWCS